MPNDCMGRPGDRSRSETPGNPPPDSFVMLHVPGTKGTGGTTIQVAKRFEAAIARVGDFDALAKLGEPLPGRRGRARGRVATLEGHSERLYLRPARHGGALGFLWRGGFLGTRRARHELEVAQRLRHAGARSSRPSSQRSTSKTPSISRAMRAKRLPPGSSARWRPPWGGACDASTMSGAPTRTSTRET